MKKYLPLILFVLGITVFAGVYFLVIRGGKAEPAEEKPVVELPFEQKPMVSLTPIKDGHWLRLVIDDIKVSDAASMDYELLYKVSDGRTQGVPGTIKLAGQKSIERELLLGSESSGKFRYDEGVEEGTLTLRFRDAKGRLIGRLVSDFHLQTGTKELASVDGGFVFNLSKIPKKGVFFLVMQTFTAPGLTSQPAEGPFGIFTEDVAGLSGESQGDWTRIESSSGLGFFYR